MLNPVFMPKQFHRAQLTYKDTDGLIGKYLI